MLYYTWFMKTQRFTEHEAKALAESHNSVYGGESIPEALEIIIKWMKKHPKFRIIIDFEVNELVLKRK